MLQEVFFNSSLPRACSTLFQNVLGQNPKIHVTPTDGVLELLYSARQQFATSPEFKAQDSDLMQKGWLSFCRAGLYGFYEAVTDKPYVISKSRGWGLYYSWLENFLPTPKVICLVRDIKEIVASLEELHRKQEAVSTDGMVNHAQMQNTTTAKRVDTFLNSQPLGLALERLGEIIRFGNADKILFIRAEDFTSNPQKQIDRVYEYLNINSYTHDFNNIEQITTEDDSVYGLTNSLHTIRKEIRPLEPKAEKVLGKEITQWFNQGQFEWFEEAFGYGKHKYRGLYV